jgi:SEC-C motif-containing protein
MQEISYFCRNTQFQKLDILEVVEGVDESYVSFNAHLVQRNQRKELIEKSFFIKVGKQWLYRDAVNIEWHNH